MIEPLGPKHDRATFLCGVPILDDYLHKQAIQDLKKHVAVPFALTSDGVTIAGYYTLSQYAVHLDVIPPEVAKKLPKYPTVPTTLLGRLAVSIAFRGQGHGATLLMDALHPNPLHANFLVEPGSHATKFVEPLSDPLHDLLVRGGLAGWKKAIPAR